MKYDFKIAAFTEDADFSISLATECNKYGFSLSFIDLEEDIKEEVRTDTIIVILIDLNSKKYNENCNQLSKLQQLAVYQHVFT